jgi:hypothetical protein
VSSVVAVTIGSTGDERARWRNGRGDASRLMMTVLYCCVVRGRRGESVDGRGSESGPVIAIVRAPAQVRA